MVREPIAFVSLKWLATLLCIGCLDSDMRADPGTPLVPMPVSPRVDASAQDASMPLLDGSRLLTSDATDDANSEADNGQPRCRPLDDPGQVLKLLPEIPLAIIRQVGGACDSLGPAQVLLYNAGATKIRLLDIAVTDGVFTATADLPHDLAPDERLPLAIDYAPFAAGEASASIIITTEDGCLESRVVGIATDVEQDAVLTFSPYIVDFGRVRLGQAAPTRAIRFLFQPGGRIANPQFEGLGATPPVFQVTSAPSNVQLDGCQALSASVKFVPTKAGTIRGQVLSGFSGRIDGQELAGTSVVELIGTLDP